MVSKKIEELENGEERVTINIDIYMIIQGDLPLISNLTAAQTTYSDHRIKNRYLDFVKLQKYL